MDILSVSPDCAFQNSPFCYSFALSSSYAPLLPLLSLPHSSSSYPLPLSYQDFRWWRVIYLRDVSFEWDIYQSNTVHDVQYLYISGLSVCRLSNQDFRHWRVNSYLRDLVFENRVSTSLTKFPVQCLSLSVCLALPSAILTRFEKKWVEIKDFSSEGTPTSQMFV